MTASSRWARALIFLAGVLAAATAASSKAQSPAPPLAPIYTPIHYKRCKAIGEPWAGRLKHGTRLPKEGWDFFTFDPIKRRQPNRWWRRYACDFAIKKLLRVLHALRQEFPDAPRIGIGDLSRPRGGKFGKRYGGLGHRSHQSGVDLDIYYPRWDAIERPPGTVDDIDLELAQALVDGLVRAGAKYAFVGPHTGLRGPRKIVQTLAYHDDHVHVRFRVPRGRRG
jgi:murein endopeptidase